MMTTSLVFHSDAELLEGPVFDQENGLLYFVSILEGLVYCYHCATKQILSIKLESPVSCIYIQGAKQVLVASKEGFFEIDFNTLQKRAIFQIEIEDNVRYNDGIMDAAGRILIGTMGYPEVQDHIGNVFSYHQGTSKVLIENTTISNGLAFSADHKFLYFIDTPTKKVAKYHYDLNSGEVQFDSYVIHFTEDGSPDGMCMDNKGMLYIAEWGGSCVSKWNPENGKKLARYDLPCPNVTSCCFDDKANLYVTTAKSEYENDILGGGVFYIELNKI